MQKRIKDLRDVDSTPGKIKGVAGYSIQEVLDHTPKSVRVPVNGAKTLEEVEKILNDTLIVADRGIDNVVMYKIWGVIALILYTLQIYEARDLINLCVRDIITLLVCIGLVVSMLRLVYGWCKYYLLSAISSIVEVGIIAGIVGGVCFGGGCVGFIVGAIVIFLMLCAVAVAPEKACVLELWRRRGTDLVFTGVTGENYDVVTQVVHNINTENHTIYLVIENEAQVPKECPIVTWYKRDFCFETTVEEECKKAGMPLDTFVLPYSSGYTWLKDTMEGKGYLVAIEYIRGSLALTTNLYERNTNLDRIDGLSERESRLYLSMCQLQRWLDILLKELNSNQNCSKKDGNKFLYRMKSFSYDGRDGQQGLIVWKSRYYKLPEDVREEYYFDIFKILLNLYTGVRLDAQETKECLGYLNDVYKVLEGSGCLAITPYKSIMERIGITI